MEQPLVCQNPISWNNSSDWVTNTNQISIRLKSSEIKALITTLLTCTVKTFD